MSWSRSFRGGWARPARAAPAATSSPRSIPSAGIANAKDELAIVDTIANRAALAEACLALGKFEEARAQYAAILASPQGDEPSFMLGRARAEFGLGEPALAVDDARRTEGALARLSLAGRPSSLRQGA